MGKAKNSFGINVKGLKLIGQGYEGKVYLLSQDRVIKIFHSKTSCRNQVKILFAVQQSKLFPKILQYDNYSIIMSYVYGEVLSKYLKKNSLNRVLSHELVHMLEEFKKYNFKRLDMRPEHIFVQPDNTVRVIDPRGSYTINQPYPKLLLKGLREYHELNTFFNYIRDDYPDYYSYWKRK